MPTTLRLDAWKGKNYFALHFSASCASHRRMSKKSAPKIGRPKLPPAVVRGKRVIAWLNTSDRALVEQATHAAGEISVSRWSSLVIVAAARALLASLGVNAPSQ
jgi:hypothetical protein